MKISSSSHIKSRHCIQIVVFSLFLVGIFSHTPKLLAGSSFVNVTASGYVDVSGTLSLGTYTGPENSLSISSTGTSTTTSNTIFSMSGSVAEWSFQKIVSSAPVEQMHLSTDDILTVGNIAAIGGNIE